MLITSVDRFFRFPLGTAQCLVVQRNRTRVRSFDIFHKINPRTWSVILSARSMYHNLQFHVPRRFNTGEKSFFVVVVVVVFSSFNSSVFLGGFLFCFFFLLFLVGSTFLCVCSLRWAKFKSSHITSKQRCVWVTTPVDIQKSAVGNHSYSCRVAHS